MAVYVAVNGAEPKLNLTDISSVKSGGKTLPTLTFSNTGDAHGRVEGTLEGVDANGQKLEWTLDGSPIMPGQTRALPLTPRPLEGQTLRDPAYPIRIFGVVDWEGGSFKIDTEVK